TAARLIAITAVVGLFLPQHEQADPSKRLSGAEGIAACNDVLGRESNPTRRVQLILARAIHHIEAGEYDAAIADARLAETDQPALAATPAFKLSFHLSVLEVQAMALVAMGKTQEAAMLGVEMGEAAPYDLVNMLRAAPLVDLSADYGPREARFYDALVRIYPTELAKRAAARERGGDFRGSAEDFEAWTALVATVLDDPEAFGPAHAAIGRALAGDAEQAEAHAKAAQAALQAMIASGKSDGTADISELLDFYRVWSLAKAGKLGEARLLFASRAAWTKPSPAAVGTLARLLQQGAKPEELSGLLAGDPARFKAEQLAARVRALTDVAKSDNGAKRYQAIRAPISSGQFTAFSDNVWHDGASKYLAKQDEPKLKARLIDVLRNGDGIPAEYAIILHSALVAKAQGKKTFMLMPLQKYIYRTYVRIGDPGEAGVIGPLSYDADRVVADLSPIIPPPAKGR
ncbi:MAG: hypothetical protein QOH04_1722, partial [Sphingomonadales bacterium]|nr:hypothetical protein [Sphingomonadales bacterium]